MKEFKYVPSLGMLCYDKVLFETHYPILFTVIDAKENLYLCVCCQYNSSGRKWLITNTTAALVVSLLRNRITIRDAFLYSNRVRISITDSVNGMVITENDVHDWDAQNSIMLPDAGELIDAEDGEFDDEIEYYQNKMEARYSDIDVQTTIKSDLIKKKDLLYSYWYKDKAMINVDELFVRAEVVKKMNSYWSKTYLDNLKLDRKLNYRDVLLTGEIRYSNVCCTRKVPVKYSVEREKDSCKSLAS